MTVVLINGLWQGAPIALVATLIANCLPRRHAATRYAVWFAALIFLAVVPIASQWHPARTLPTPLEMTATATTSIAVHAASASGLWLMLVWAAGTAFFLFRLALSYVRIHLIVRRATPAPELGSKVLTSDSVAVPIAAGLLSPVVIIPTQLLATLDRIDLESLVRHERAHIKRGDIVGNFVQRIIEAFLFFNPWVYVIGRQLLKEREAACDDWAVHGANEAHRYASCLVRLAQSAPRAHHTLLTPSAIGPKSMLVGRVARLLDGKATQLKVNYIVLGASVTAFALLAAVLQPAKTLAANTLPANCNQYATVLEPAQPDIAKSDYRANAAANALVSVGANGKPVSAKIVNSSGFPAIDAATIKAAMSSTYSPQMSNCKATSGSYVFRVKTGPM
jgi:beta-lactamase regulating signal transducer with metallopeptidase domain